MSRAGARRVCASLGIALAAVWLLPSAGEAQRLDLWFDATATHALVPGGVTGSERATYGLIGARLRLRAPRWPTLGLALGGGRGARTGQGAWLHADAAADMTRRFGPVWLGLGAGAFGLDYADPFSYAIYGARLRPHLAARFGGMVLRVRGRLTRGRWHRAGASGALSVSGGSLHAARRFGPVRVHVRAEGYTTENAALEGGYRGVGAGLAFNGGPWTASLRAGAWDTPRGTELGYHARLRYRLREGVSIRIGAGEAGIDLLHGAERMFAASVGLSWHVGALGGDGGESDRVPVVQVTGEAPDGRRVRFRLRAPDADRVALAGDFSRWQPLPMHRRDGAWTVELALRPGLHHFAFLIDGERWTVPDHAPGVTSDEWGRRNASIVITRE